MAFSFSSSGSPGLCFHFDEVIAKNCFNIFPHFFFFFLVSHGISKKKIQAVIGRLQLLYQL